MVDVVVLIHGTGDGAIAEFETRALAIMRAHGGRLLSAFRPRVTPETPEVPDEIHVLRFPSLDALDAYRADPLLEALAPLRRQVIASTRVFVAGEELGY